MDTYIPRHLIEELPFGSQQQKRTDHFVKGPLPLWWFQTAARECSHSALIVGLILFFRAGIGIPPKPITKHELSHWGLSRNAKDAAIQRLEKAVLIKRQKSGRQMVPVLDLETRKPSS